MSKIVKWISHNQGLFCALAISVGLLIWTYGCESQVSSLLNSDKRITRNELVLEIEQEQRRLEGELDALLKRAEVKMAQLDRQDAIKRKLFEFAALTAQTGQINPAGVVALLGTVLGGGLLIDNRVKDKVIKNRPLKEA